MRSQLQDIFDASSSGPPVFVVGHPRSGTTLLTAMLGRHPDFAAPPETNFFMPFLYPEIRRVVLTGRVDSGSHSEQLLASLGITSDTLRSQFKAGGPQADDIEKAFFCWLMNTYASTQMKSRWVEKTPYHLWHLRVIYRLFPNAKVVCMVRDGRDAVLSTLKLPNHNKGRSSLSWHALNWCRAAALTRYWESHQPKSFKVVKFEELLAAPEATIRSVCEHIEAPYSPRQLDSNQATTAKNESEYWKEKTNKPIDVSRCHAWRDGANKEDVRELNAVMKRDLEAFGYPDTDAELRGLGVLQSVYWKLRPMQVKVQRYADSMRHRIASTISRPY